MKEKTNLTQNSLIPISFVFVLVGGVFALGQAYSKILENEKNLSHYSGRLQINEDKLDSIMLSLGRIEERLAK